MKLKTFGPNLYSVDWKPLQRVLKGQSESPIDFMYMGTVRTHSDGDSNTYVLFSYKHSLTRGYLHISEEGDFFSYLGNEDAYEVITRYEAMGRCLGFAR